MRRRRQYLADSGLTQPGGIAECIGRLKEEGYSLEAALELIACVSIEPRFTPHPTESTRRTILRKQQRIAQDLLDRLNAGLTRVELETIWSRVRLEIASIWQTEEHPREGLTVAGVQAVVGELRAKLPDSKILLLAIFPRGTLNDPQRAQAALVNTVIAKLDDGKTVKFLDLGPKFLEFDGTLPRSLMPDLLHPNGRGYQIWAEVMEPTLDGMLN